MRQLILEQIFPDLAPVFILLTTLVIILHCHLSSTVANEKYIDIQATLT